MGVVAAASVVDKSADTSGVSVLTAARRISDSRSGTLYDPTQMAAIVPVHTHPLADNRYLVVYSQRWHDATLSSSDPGAYTDYEVDTNPGWVIATAPTGTRTLLGTSYTIPCRFPYDTAIVTGAVSRASDYLFLLYQLTVDGISRGAVAHWWVNTTVDSILPLAEELVPGTDSIVFDRGLWYATPYLIVIGAHVDTHELYLARKPWSRIGTNTSTPFTLDGIASAGPGLPSTWQYVTDLGWSADITEAAPVRTIGGVPITSVGPVSTVTHIDRTFLATVSATSTARYAVVYATRGGSTWTLDGDPIPLGDAVNGSYVGGTLQFQQQLTASSSMGEMTSPDNTAALPYVISTQSTAGGADRLDNTWSVWPVARVSGKGRRFHTLAPMSAVVATNGSAPRFQLALGITGGGMRLRGWPPGNVFLPDAVALALTGSAPIVITTLPILPAGAPATLTGFVPTVRPGTNLRPAALTPQLTGSAPLIYLSTVLTTVNPVGSGTLTAVAKAFVPSRMTKNGSQTWATSATWADITPWTAVNTGGYTTTLGDSNTSIIVSVGKPGATLAASVPFSGGSSSRTHTIRIVRVSDGAVIVTGSGVSANSGTCTASTTATVVDNEHYKVQMNSSGSSAGSVTTVTPTFTIS